jgi:RNA polymerase sigma factor (TIGR02999 family)
VSNVTQILDRARQGDPKAAEELLPLVYDELHRLAVTKMAQQPAGQTLQATALVHEAWLRLDGAGRQWEGRRHFFAAAAQAMRHILIERARRKLRARHGGELERVDLDAIEIAAPTDDDERLLLINSALDELAVLAPDKAEVVKLRFFVGLEEKEIAELLGVTPRTVERYWSYAKAWLFERVAQPGPSENK